MSATAEQVTEARALGWRPQAEFRGKETDFVDADVFLQRGREIMPLLKKNNERLERELADTRGQMTALQQTVKDAQTAVEELKKFSTEMTRQAAEAARTELLTKLKQAKKDGDVDAEVELTDQLSETSAAIREAKKAPTKEEPAPKKPNGDQAPNTADGKAEFDAWQAANEWYGTDDMKTGVANGIAAKLRREKSTLVGVEFYKEVAKQTEAFMDRDRPNPNKTEGGGRGSGGGSGGGNGKGTGYADMPQGGKDYCEKLMDRGDITIGKGKTFETADAFRAHYAKQYFARSE